MINFNTKSNLLILISFLSFAGLFIVELTIPEQHEIIRFGYDTSFLVLIIGFILWQKNIQQLIGLFLYLVDYNLNIFKNELFQIQNDYILQFAKHYAFYVIVASCVFLLPTTFNKYKITPLTNRTDIKDSTIILTSILMTILIQATIRFTL